MGNRLSITDAAHAYLSAGLCALPAIRAEKRPAVGRWKQYQTRMPTPAELSAWLANKPDAVCILCGRASGNVEAIDFDAGGELFSAWWDRIPADLRERLIVEITPSGGRHVIYRCVVAVSGNLKLAQRKDGEKVVTLIETRGEGGLILCAPTGGYEIVQGDLCDPPRLTAAERDILLQAAWELNEYRPPMVDGPTGSANVGQNGAWSAENSHSGSCPPENGQRRDCPSDNGNGAPMSADNSNIRPISADSSENHHCATDSSDNAACPSHNSHNSACQSNNADRPGDDFNRRGDVRAVLENVGWVRLTDRQGAGGNEYWRRPGKNSGWSATLKDRVFYVFSSNAAPFEPNQAYSPFAVYTLLTCGGDFEQAARCLRELGFGGDCSTDNTDGVDISAIMRMSVAPGACPSDNGDCGQSLADDSDIDADGPEIVDPGTIPKHLFAIPGLVAEVMEFTLANAPYPNVGLAFCGAMALQSYLCGRKVQTVDDLRPNIYLLALASSGTGKDFPRKVNSRVLFEIGHISALGDKFASGQGIQDALLRSNAMLFQNDEMDGVLRQINFDRDNKLESIPNILLTLYTSADAVYPIRVKAGQKEALSIDQPHLTLFGTATPQYFYESLSQRMLTNGLFARMMIVDIGKRGRGQRPGSARHVPDSVLQKARWWAEYQPGRAGGNLHQLHPDPRPVPLTPEAEEAVDRLQRMGEDEYAKADAAGDEMSRTAWSRTCENAKKLALLYACSENHENPIIGLPAVEWATEFAMHQTRRQLYLAATYVATSEFDGECKKVLRFLKRCRDSGKARDYPTPDWKLRRHLALSPNVYDNVIEALSKQQRMVFRTVPTKTKPRSGWVLL